ncbi:MULTISPECIES: alpha/beta fold hydrolase [Burkholderia cepacia complex]|uniref:alpha/beta hydrolase family protein n=1 Tax=Burkholderia cepacia complex TaxID=87882 RepID=UPI0023DDDEFC|nr:MULTISPECIES: alpha/beta fold hydrolase [Burkholderia cepacia complex]MDF3091185.1 alpha/beta fold hydrolase [Burkholderia semiarida]MDF3106750.1 alpha/beta fold hydrolase [Burkholderia semiarida]WJN75281.1 Hydrolase, alpha/beta fold family [Burkholderia anthina]
MTISNENSGAPQANRTADALPPEPVTLRAADGYELRAHVWRHRGGGAVRPVTVVNCATSVRCDYYFRFAAWLFAQGRDVLVYDYRGIGGSRPARLAKLDANWLDWGRLDCEAALHYARDAFPGQPLDVVAHSIGGCVLGLAASNVHARHVVTVGAQYAYWRDYLPAERRRMWWKWHVAMPALAAVFGYVPAKRLGWMEDTPRGVALSWARSQPRFEDGYIGSVLDDGATSRTALPARFAGLSAPMLAIGIDDDAFGTVDAIERLAGYYTGSNVTHLRIAPADIGVDAIGHFAFFHSRFTDTLWPVALYWLQHGVLPADAPGVVHALHPASRGRLTGSGLPGIAANG